MKRTLIIFFLMFVLTMPTIVKAEGKNDPQQDISQQDQQQQDQQRREGKQRDQQQQDQRQRDQQQRDRQQQDQRQRDQQQRDQQQRDRQQRDRQQQDQRQWDQQQRERQQQNYRQPDNRYDWSRAAYHNDNWQRAEHFSHDVMPFKWHERVKRFSPDYKVGLIYNQEWDNRFPGLHMFRWADRRGEGFWYHNRHIVDAILFCDDSDEVVSIGFMYDGIFIMIRDDDQAYENHDSFFLLWWNQNR